MKDKKFLETMFRYLVLFRVKFLYQCRLNLKGNKTEEIAVIMPLRIKPNEGIQKSVSKLN